MHLAGKATSLLLDKNEHMICSSAGWSRREFAKRKDHIILMARLAALLHDIGHAPFSHAGEQRLFPGSYRHEDYSASIVNGPEIGPLIDAALRDTGFNRTDLVEVLKGGMLPPAYSFLGQVISSPYDVDKMDYLLRDSHYCGVEYGTFDIRRLISTLTLCEEEPGEGLSLAVEEGGYHALEAFVLARYFMFTQVYFHRVRRANDLILTEFIQELLQDQYGSDTYPSPEDLSEYLNWDDSAVMSNAVTRSDSAKENLAWMICHRRHPKTAYETLPHPDPMEARMAFRRLLPEVKRQFPSVRFWRDNATDHPERYRHEDIPIKVGGTRPTWKSFARTSEVLRGIQEVGQVRLYAYAGDDDNLISEIHRFCRSLLA